MGGRADTRARSAQDQAVTLSGLTQGCQTKQLSVDPSIQQTVNP